MITIKVRGTGKILKNLSLVRASGYTGSLIGLNRGLQLIKDKSTQYLRDNSESSRWWGGTGPYKSRNINRPWDTIKGRWVTKDSWIEGNTISAILGNTSPHAHFVEFGTNTPITSTGGGEMFFWGGDRYGWQRHMTVKGQVGKHYLQYGVDMSKDLLVDVIKSEITSLWNF